MSNAESLTIPTIPETPYEEEILFAHEQSYEQPPEEPSHRYSRQLADGRIVHADSIEELVKECPFLSKIAAISIEAAQRFVDREEAGRKALAIQALAEKNAKSTQAESQRATDQATRQAEKISLSKPAPEIIEQPKQHIAIQVAQEAAPAVVTPITPIEQPIVVAEAEINHQRTVQAVETTQSSSVEDIILPTDASETAAVHIPIKKQEHIKPETPIIVETVEPIAPPNILTSAAVAQAFQKLVQLIETSPEPPNSIQQEQSTDPDSAIPKEVRFANYNNTSGEQQVTAEATVDRILPPVQELAPTTIDTTFSEIVQAIQFSEITTANETVFDEVTLETFDALMVLSSNEDSSVEISALPDLLEPSETKIQEDQSVLELDPTADDTQDLQQIVGAPIETPVAISLETFSVEPQTPPQPSRLEVIVEQAEDQPAEQTLIQLITSLPEAVAGIKIIVEDLDDAEPQAENPEHDVVYEILDALYELEEAISTSHQLQPLAMESTDDFSDIAEFPTVDENITEEPLELILTPLITEKMLSVLRTLGYEEPQQALITMAKTQGMAATLQLFQRTAQLITRDDYREIMAFGNAIAATKRKATTGRQATPPARLGQALLWITHKFSLEREVINKTGSLASATA